MRRCLLPIFMLLAVVSASAQTPQYTQYINEYYPLAIEQMKQYKIPASITLAQALLESNAGQSDLARNANNHFGIKCHNWSGDKTYKDDDQVDDCFRVYKSVRDSYEDHSIFLKSGKRYASLFTLSPTDYVGWARGLKLAGYATNPAYADKLIHIIESYNLDRYDSPDWKYAPVYTESNAHVPMLANGLVYIVARQGDTMQSIADEFGIPRRKLIQYNDLYKQYVPAAGDIIYLHRKNARAKKPYNAHTVSNGESMYSISQTYGVRLRNLYKMNKDKGELYDYSPAVGDVLRLR